VTLPYNSKDKFLAVLSLHSREPQWQVDFNLHWYGVQRLPDNSNPIIDINLPGYSDPFSILGMQYTHSFKRIELFTGVENVFDFRQLQPIISWQNPFSEQFDTSYAWGPTRGREMYAGLRFNFND